MFDTVKIKSEAAIIAKEFNLSLLVVFGSQARQRTHPKSDVDFGFLAKKKLGLKDVANLQHEFSKRLKINNLEMHDLNSAPPLLLKHVARDAVLLYEEEEIGRAHV